MLRRRIIYVNLIKLFLDLKKAQEYGLISSPLWLLKLVLNIVKHIIFIRQTPLVLLFYNLCGFLIGSDIKGIQEVKKYLDNEFVVKDLRKHRYFVRIEIAYKAIKLSFLRKK